MAALAGQINRNVRTIKGGLEEAYLIPNQNYVGASCRNVAFWYERFANQGKMFKKMPHTIKQGPLNIDCLTIS